MYAKAGVLGLLATIWLPASAQPAPDCNAKDSFETARCTGQEFDKLDKELNRVYQRLLKSLSKPAEYNLDYPKIRARLIESQRLWVQFRDKDCEAYMMLNGGGTAHAAEHSICMSVRTEHRIKELTQWGG
jgi:uncharacterized protein YecT (DUF1311 family)